MANYQYQGRGTQTFQKLPGYRNLAAWQAASDLSHMISQMTARLGPAYWRLANQMRGAAISAAGNIAEGYCSGTLPNYIRYCNHARGSLGELGSYLQDCERDSLLTGDELTRHVKQYGDTSFFLDRLVQALVQKEKNEPPSPQPYSVREAAATYVVDDTQDWRHQFGDWAVTDEIEPNNRLNSDQRADLAFPPVP
jgi:four helix bundle protein